MYRYEIWCVGVLTDRHITEHKFEIINNGFCKNALAKEMDINNIRYCFIFCIFILLNFYNENSRIINYIEQQIYHFISQHCVFTCFYYHPNPIVTNRCASFLYLLSEDLSIRFYFF